MAQGQCWLLVSVVQSLETPAAGWLSFCLGTKDYLSSTTITGQQIRIHIARKFERGLVRAAEFGAFHHAATQCWCWRLRSSLAMPLSLSFNAIERARMQGLPPSLRSPASRDMRRCCSITVSCTPVHQAQVKILSCQ